LIRTRNEGQLSWLASAEQKSFLIFLPIFLFSAFLETLRLGFGRLLLFVLHHRLDGIFQNLAAKAEECHRA
jgi:hypothetical protein